MTHAPASRGARRAAASLTLALLTSTVLGGPAQAATFVATDEASLIQAINDANASAGADTIVLSGDIALSGALPDITDLATIDFQGHDLTAFSGGTLNFNAGGTLVVPAGSSFAPGFAIGVAGNVSGVLTVVNQGAITSFGDAINGSVPLDVNNSGSVASTGYAGVYAGRGGTIVNSGSITGGTDANNGYGVILDGNGSATLTNQAGGSISGTAGGVRIWNSGGSTLNLEAGSTTDDIKVVVGAVTANIAGTVSGDYDSTAASAASTVNLAGGSIANVRFGSAGDTFNYSGGTISGVVTGGAGGATDTFNSTLGAGNSASLNMSNLSGFEQYYQKSGSLTLTGTGNYTNVFAYSTWVVTPGASVTLAGTLNSYNAAIEVRGNGSPGTISIASGSVINSYVGTYFNSGSAHVLNNAGTINASGVGSASNGNLTATNSGTIAASLYQGMTLGYGGTITNSGTISGGSDATQGIGIQSLTGATITNAAGGSISGTAAGIQSGTVSGQTSYGGLLSVNNAAGATINGQTGIVTAGSSSLTLNNSGLVVGFDTAINAGGSGPVNITNTASGTIGSGTVSGGVYTAGGNGDAIFLTRASTINNAGTIDGANQGISAGAALTLTNTGSISGAASHGLSVVGAANITNAGNIEGGNSGMLLNGASALLNSGTITGHGTSGSNGDGISAAGALNLTNSGTIHGDLNAGVVAFNGGLLVDNQVGGTISGGSGQFGYAINSNGSLNLTNAGTLSAGAPNVALNVEGDAVINLLAGSTVNGSIFSNGVGTTNTLIIGGTVNGRYSAGNGASSDITLAASGSIGDIYLGGGDDRFVDGGGTYASIDAGGGIDTYALSSAADGSYDLGSVLGGFEQFQKLGMGTLTLTGFGGNDAMPILAGDGGNDDGVLAFNGTSGLTGDIYVNGAIIRADSAGAFGTGTIHSIDPTIQYAASGIYTNDIALEVAAPASGDPTRLEAINGATATLTGVIATGTTPTTDPTQYVTIGGNGKIVLTNATNSWTGTTTINAGATLQGASYTISGSNIVENGALNYVQAGTGTVTQDISGSGRVGVSGLAAGNTLTFAGNLTNSGIDLTDGSHIVLAGISTTSGNGVKVTGANATVDVTDNASLTSNSGPAIFSFAANTTVNNLGAIAGYNSTPTGVGLFSGGTINNGSATDSTALIQGGNTGSINGSALVTIDNYGIFRGLNQSGITGGALAITNRAGAQIIGQGNAGVVNSFGVSANNALTLVNAGQIVGRGTGVGSDGSLNLTNSGLIGSGYLSGTTFSYSDGYFGVRALNGGMIGNLAGGQILGTLNGIYAQGAALVVTNDGSINGQIGIVSNGSVMLTNNLGGTISGTNSAFNLTGGGAGSITNFGDLTGGVVSTGGGNLTIDNKASGNIVRVAFGSAIDMSNGGKLTLTNAGDIVGSGWGVVGRNAGDAIVNSGRIASGTISGNTITAGGNDAIQLSLGGSVTNLSGGMIIGGNTGVTGSGVTLDNRAGASISGANAVSIANGGQVTNAGSIAGRTASGDIGVVLNTNGTLTNLAGGTITGARAVQFTGTNALLTNSGAITSTAANASQGYGALFFNGGTVNNLAGGSINSSSRGVSIQGGVGSLTNAGSVQSGSDAAVLFNGGSVINQLGGTISSTSANGVTIQGGVAGGNHITNYGTINAGSFAATVYNGGTIDNYGSVTAGANGNALTLDGSGTVTNHAGGILTATAASDAWGILGQIGVQTIVNDGTISAGSGIVTSTTGTTIANSGSVTGQLYGAWALSGQISLANSGTITGGTNAVLSTAGGGVTNSGTLRATGGDALSFGAAATVTNQLGGLIDGANIGIRAGGALNLTNAGTITAANAAGVYTGGALTLDNSGTIRTGATNFYDGVTVINGATASIANSGMISAATASAIAVTGASTIVNSGTLTGGSDATYGYGVQFAAGSSGSFVNQSGGTIGGGVGSGVLWTDNAVSIDLQSGSTANGAILSTGAGARTLVINGGLNGVYDASAGTGIDTVTLGASGSLAGGNLGAGADSLTIYGGTLSGLIDGGADGDALTFDLAGSASFDAGYFAGFESRAKSGAGTLTLTGTDGMTIDFAVDGGTLAVSGGSAINDGAAVNLASGTTLQLAGNEAIRTLTGTGSVMLGGNTLSLAGNDTASFGGSISGTGSLAKFGGGVFTLTGGNGYTGPTYVMGGTLAIGGSNGIASASALYVNSGATFDLAGFDQTFAGLGGSGAVTLGAGRLTIDNSIASQFDGAISGTGGLTKAGSGRLMLTGANTYTGSTLLNGGALIVNGSLASTVTVASGATLGGFGQVGGLVVNAGGMLSPGDSSAVFTSGIHAQIVTPTPSYGVITVAGNATFNAGSYYDVDINPTMSDLTVVTGATTINGGTVRVNAEDATYNPLTVYTIILSAGGVSGAFGGVTDNLAYLDTSLSYTSNQVNLEARRNDITFSDVAANPNQAAVADAVQSIGSGTLYDAVLVQSDAGARTAFNALSGEIYAATPTVLLDDSRHVRNAMLNADKGAQGFGAWLEGMRSNGEIEVDAARGTGGIDHDRDQLAGGITYGVGALSLGAMVGRSSTDVDLDARLSSAKVKSTFVGGQLGYRAGQATLRGGAAYAWHDIDTDRNIVFPGFADVANSSQHGRTMQLWGDAGFDLAPGGDVLEPFAGFALIDNKVDGTDEDGGVAALDVGSVKQTAELARLGLRMKGSFAIAGTSATLSPHMSVALQRGWGDRDASVTSAFSGSSTFNIMGSRLSRDNVEFDGGVDLDVGAARFGLRYDGSLAGNNADHAAKASVSFRF